MRKKSKQKARPKTNSTSSIKKSTEKRLTKDTYQTLCGYGAKVKASHVAERSKMVDESDCARTIAVVSDGSHVAGLGNIKSKAVVPVLEGKIVLLKEVGKVAAVSISVATQDVQELTMILQNISGSFGGIFLESISAPKCFELEKKVQSVSSVPIVHSNKDGTAIAVLAGLINAHKVTQKNIRNSRVAILGAGANGIGIAKLLTAYGIGDVVVVDRDGVISTLRTNISGEKEALANYTNKEGRTGGVLEAVTGADVLIETIKTGMPDGELIRMMAQKPIVFTLAESKPILTPKELIKAGAYIVATESVEYPNQIHSDLVMPALARAIINNKLTLISEKMKTSVAETIAQLIKNPTSKKIIPSLFDRRLIKSVVHVLEK